MAKVRFVGDEPHEVPDLGRTVKPDELVEVGDDLYKNREWAESLWSATDNKSTAKDKE